MPAAISDLIYQLPVAGLMLVVVWKFLQVIKERDENWLETVRKRDEHFLSELNKHEHKASQVHDETIQVLRHNNTVLTQATKVMERMEEQLREDAFARDHQRRAGGNHGI